MDHRKTTHQRSHKTPWETRKNPKFLIGHLLRSERGATSYCHTAERDKVTQSTVKINCKRTIIYWRNTFYPQNIYPFHGCLDFLYLTQKATIFFENWEKVITMKCINWEDKMQEIWERNVNDKNLTQNVLKICLRNSTTISREASSKTKKKTKGKWS